MGGTQREAAVKCWFTAGGRAIPLSMKIRDEDGEIRGVSEIGVLYSEKKYYAGLPVWEYRCAVKLNGRMRETTLRFFPDQCRWSVSVDSH